jgi:hypothetical protein
MKLGFCCSKASATILAPAIMTVLLAAPASAQQGMPDLSAEWWQWALSIPTAQNPQLDPTGANCMIGQHGSVWFLAGVFGGGTASRNCTVPADTTLFFPVINSLQINTPNVCGQGPQNIPVKDLRQFASAGLAGAIFSVEIDGKPYNNISRVQSSVFATALPADNVFNAPCIGAGLGSVPAGIYSPSVDDGFYVRLNPQFLQPGSHTVHIHAASPFLIDVTYNLAVVPVLKK